MGCTVCRLREAVVELAAEFTRRMKGDLPAGWVENMQKYVHDLQSHPAALATRQVSQKCLNHFADMLPELMGGSADLSPSNLTRHQKSVDFTGENPAGITSPMACVNLVCLPS